MRGRPAGLAQKATALEKAGARELLAPLSISRHSLRLLSRAGERIAAVDRSFVGFKLRRPE